MRALGIVFGGTFLLAIVQWVLPFTSGFMQVGLALILLEVPFRVVPDFKNAPLWLRIGDVATSLRLGGATILIVFPLFVGGFHLAYTALLDRPVDWEVTRLARWSEDLEYAPANACGRAETSVWTQETQLWIAAPAVLLQAKLTTDTPPRQARLVRCVRGAQPMLGAVIAPDASGTYRPPKGHGVFFDLGDARDFALELREGSGSGTPIPSDMVRQGYRSVSISDDGALDSSRDYWWLLAYVLIHLGLVAYPEEYFFRGYLLPRLNQRLGTPRRLFGVQVGWALVWSSLAFALLHPILIPGPHRLLVFFPALLFGWLATKQRDLGAAILVHAMSNVLLAIVSRMYG